MNNLKIICKTEKAKNIVLTPRKMDNKTKIIMKIVGYREEVICEEPYTVMVTFKRMTKLVFQTLLSIKDNLTIAFYNEGLVSPDDYEIEVNYD